MAARASVSILNSGLLYIGAMCPLICGEGGWRRQISFPSKKQYSTEVVLKE